MSEITTVVGVADPTESCMNMRSKWLLPEALMRGTTEMRERAKEFLPQHPNESDEQYQIRSKQAVLRNFYKRTVITFTGKVFTAQPVVKVDKKIEPYLEDVDLTGRHLNVFCREVFQEAVVKGLSFVLVDYPTAPENATLADEKNLNLRPYLIHIKPEQILGWKSDLIGGVQLLTQLRIHEIVHEDCSELYEFSERIVQRVRVWDRLLDGTVQQTVYEQDNSIGDEEAWVMVSQNVYKGVTEIPVAVFYTNRKDFYIAEPPLEDLAYMNLEHFQIRSDQRNALSVASFPILTASGIDMDNDQIEFGPNKMITSKNTDAKFAYLESGGVHLEAGRLELQDLENSMRVFASQFELTNKSATATGRAIDAHESSASLKDWALMFGDFLEEVIRFMNMWSGVESDDYNVQMDTDFGVKVDDNIEFDIILKAYATGLLSKQSALNELQRRGLLDSEFDIDTEIALLDIEPPSTAEGLPASNTGKFTQKEK